MTKVAVILPVYFADHPIIFDKAIQSILLQTEACHLFVCQDGTLTKELHQLCESYPKEKVSLLYSHENKGLPSTLNRGIRMALKQGYEYIARMDADDISMPNRLELQLKYLRQHPKVDLVGCQAELIDKSGNYCGIKKVNENIIFNSLKFNCDLIHPSVMFKSTFFEDYGFYDESLLKSQDYELWLRASQKGAVIRNIQLSLISFRYEPELISRRKKEQWFNIKIKYKYLNKWQFLPGIARHLFILICPTFILKWLLIKKTN